MMSIHAAILGWWRYLRKKLTSRLMVSSLLVCTALLVYFLSRDHLGLVRSSSAAQDGGSRSHKQPQHARLDNPFTFFNVTQIHAEHLGRVQHMLDVCRGPDGDMFGLSPENWAYGRIEIDRQVNYLYCPLLKAGSTFFRRIFFTMRESHRLANPYHVPIQKALSAKRSYLEDILPLTVPSTSAFLDNSTAILFVREPFSRLLSGYADKLFAPNPYFWSHIGRHVVSQFRQSPTHKSIKCGHDVTFAEFVSYVLNGEASNSSYRDAHFTPSYDQCKPCHLNYTVLGKMETFQADVAYTLALLGRNVSKEELAAWARDSTLDAIMDSTVSPFGWRTSVRKCMTWYEALLRVWRKLQIRGVLLFEHKFPWLPEFAEKFVTVRMFSSMVKRLHGSSGKEELQQQKREALVEAYSTVPVSDLRKLVQVFQLDFDLFDYDSNPNYIFDQKYVQQYRDRRQVFNISSV